MQLSSVTAQNDRRPSQKSLLKCVNTQLFPTTLQSLYLYLCNSQVSARYESTQKQAAFFPGRRMNALSSSSITTDPNNLSQAISKISITSGLAAAKGISLHKTPRDTRGPVSLQNVVLRDRNLTKRISASACRLQLARQHRKHISSFIWSTNLLWRGAGWGGQEGEMNYSLFCRRVRRGAAWGLSMGCVKAAKESLFISNRMKQRSMGRCWALRVCLLVACCCCCCCSYLFAVYIFDFVSLGFGGRKNKRWLLSNTCSSHCMQAGFCAWWSTRKILSFDCFSWIKPSFKGMGPGHKNCNHTKGKWDFTPVGTRVTNFSSHKQLPPDLRKVIWFPIPANRIQPIKLFSSHLSAPLCLTLPITSHSVQQEEKKTQTTQNKTRKFVLNTRLIQMAFKMKIDEWNKQFFSAPLHEDETVNDGPLLAEGWSIPAIPRLTLALENSTVQPDRGRAALGSQNLITQKPLQPRMI